MDIYRAAAPSLDLFAPDIYIPDFKGTCALYNRSGNPLFIPEAQDQVGNLFWALGHHAALGWSAFGIEDLKPDGQVAQAYKLLSEVLPQLAEWQAAGKANGLLVLNGEKSEPVSLGGYKITLSGGMGLGTQTPKPDAEAELAGGALWDRVHRPVTGGPSPLLSIRRRMNSCSLVRMEIRTLRSIQV